MNTFIRFVSMLTMLVFLFGCYTQTPMPAPYSYSVQHKMQSAYHWKVLAEDVAGQIRDTLRRSGYLDQPIYVRPDCKAPIGFCESHHEPPFGEGFYDLLTAQLLGQGLKVSTQQDGSLVVTNKVQIVRHNADRVSRTAPPGVMSVIGALAGGWAWVIRDAHNTAAAWAGAGATAAAVYDVTSGMFTKGVPHNEVIITTSIKDYDRYLMQKTDIYYINDADYWHYKTPPPPESVEIRGS